MCGATDSTIADRGADAEVAVIPDRTAEFPISPELVMLNHASFGLMTRTVMQLAQDTRVVLEADSLALIDVEALVPKMQRAAGAVEGQLGVARGSVALTSNATSGGAALMRSLRLGEGDQVVVLSTEYDSVLRGWRVRCEESGANFLQVRVPIPLSSTQQLLDALAEQVPGAVRVAQLSLVTSSTAIALPVEEITSWFKDRGATVLLDVAHGPGHVGLQPEQWGVSAMFGTLHKWYPTPRPVGVLWVDESLRETIRPAEVSLTWDSPDLVERFTWPGTHDPTPRLCVEAALDQWNAWEADGDLERCAKLADYASDQLAGIGTPTSDPEFFAPRLRAVTLHGRSRAAVHAALDAAGIRGWTGIGPSGETTLRVATHVFSDESDVDLLCRTVAALR
jgi:isopenicillin-N epimerase